MRRPRARSAPSARSPRRIPPACPGRRSPSKPTATIAGSIPTAAPIPSRCRREEIARRVAAAGVVGLGGATFPSAVKLDLGRRAKAIDTLIINGGECEPYLSCDDRLMRDRAAEIVDGIRIMLHATGASEALVGIEDNKPEAIAAMQGGRGRFRRDRRSGRCRRAIRWARRSI